MENPFNDNELEQFLQDETRQHRMYPSDKVWRNIHKEIHPKKSWPALTFFSLFVIVALTVLTILNNHPAQPFQRISEMVESKEQRAPVTTKKVIGSKEQSFPNNLVAEDFSKTKADEKLDLEAFENLVAAENPFAATVANIAKQEILLYHTDRKIVAYKTVEHFEKAIASNDSRIESSIKKRLDNEPTVANINQSVASNDNQSLTGQSIGTIPAASNTLSVIAVSKARVNSLYKKPIDDNPEADEYTYDANGLPKLITKHKNSRFEFQFYVTPSVSFRKLVDDKERDTYQRSASPSNVPTDLNYTVNVNDVVRHKPAMGTEVGFGVMYKLNKHLRIKTGLQLNLRQYYIDGFSTNTKLATIAIVRNNQLDTITQLSSFSNTNGYSETQVDNRLFQVSIPVGLQYDFLQGKHLGMSIGASVQPTLTLNKNLYIISTDYKSYTDGTPFLRRWNINSSAELDLTYKVGNVKWSLGPQIRYQHLPTYSDKYPIREYRLDYGLKIGITKSF